MEKLVHILRLAAAAKLAVQATIREQLPQFLEPTIDFYRHTVWVSSPRNDDEWLEIVRSMAEQLLKWKVDLTEAEPPHIHVLLNAGPQPRGRRVLNPFMQFRRDKDLTSALIMNRDNGWDGQMSSLEDYLDVRGKVSMEDAVGMTAEGLHVEDIIDNSVSSESEIWRARRRYVAGRPDISLYHQF